MKHQKNTKVIPFRKGHRFPNAAERTYFLDRALDCVLTAAASAGLLSAVLFFVTL